MTDGIDWTKQPPIVWCWECGWSGSPRKAKNKHVWAFAICPKCGAVLKTKTLEQGMKDREKLEREIVKARKNRRQVERSA